MRTGRRLAAVLTACFALLFAGRTDAQLIRSTFDHGQDGWTSNTPAEVVWNPNGYLQFADSSDNGTHVAAPQEYCTALSTLGVDGVYVLRYDMRISQIGDGTVYPYEANIYGVGGSAIWTGAQPNLSGDWVRVEIPICHSNSGWHVNSGTWDGILQGVTKLTLEIELVSSTGTGVDIAEIDNVELSLIAKPTVAMTNRSFFDPVAYKGSSNWWYRVCGRFVPIDDDYFWLDDGAGTPVKVFAPNCSGVASGDYVCATGAHGGTSNPGILISSPERVLKVHSTAASAQ